MDFEKRLIRGDQEININNGMFICKYEKIPKNIEEMTKAVAESVTKYLDHKVELIFSRFPAHNPGYHSILYKKFKTPDHYDRIYINLDNYDPSKIISTLLHELGHAFEQQIDEIAKEHNLKIFPEGADVESEYFESNFGEMQADFFEAYIVDPEYVKNNLKTDFLEGTYKTFEILFKNNDFEKLRQLINEKNSEFKKQYEDAYEKGQGIKPAWQETITPKEPMYKRAFEEEVNKEYRKYFNLLEEKYATKINQ